MLRYTFAICLLVFFSCKTKTKAPFSSNVSMHTNVEARAAMPIDMDSIVIAPIDHLLVKQLTQNAVSNIFFVRHAEKSKDGTHNPPLTNDGMKRSQVLSDLLQNVKLSAIYSTKYKRTQSTAKPVAEAKNLPVFEYSAGKVDSLGQVLCEKHHDENILIVGHSNSTPKMINAITQQTTLPPIDESDYNNLFLLKFTDEGSMRLIKLFFQP